MLHCGLTDTGRYNSLPFLLAASTGYDIAQQALHLCMHLLTLVGIPSFAWYSDSMQYGRPVLQYRHLLAVQKGAYSTQHCLQYITLLAMHHVACNKQCCLPYAMLTTASQLLADLVHPGDQAVAAQGGHGGRGNAYMRRPGQKR